MRLVPAPDRPPPVARALALASLAAAALLVALVVVFLAHHALEVVAGVAGALAAIAGGWWLVTERGWRRLSGGAVAVVGVGVVAAALFRVGSETWTTGLRLVAAVVVLTVGVGCARLALVVHLRASVGTGARRIARPAHPVLLCNPRSGGGKVDRFALRDVAAAAGVATVVMEPGHDLAALTRAAVEGGADALGMAGGDGSQALVAALAVERDLPFVCVPAGTRNHFALDLGLDRDDPRPAIGAFRDAVERRVDYATVDGRLFVNNVSLGVYATIVQEEGYREAKASTARDLLPELLSSRSEPFDLQFTAPDGTEVDGAFLLVVANNPYVLGLSPDASQRARLDSGRLGVVAVRARTGGEAARAVTQALAGRRQAGLVWEFTCEEFEVRSRSGSVYAGVDGEALELATPLRFRIHPGGLRMLVPEGNPEAVLRRRARDVHLGDLASLALGRS